MERYDHKRDDIYLDNPNDILLAQTLHSVISEKGLTVGDRQELRTSKPVGLFEVGVEKTKFAKQNSKIISTTTATPVSGKKIAAIRGEAKKSVCRKSTTAGSAVDPDYNHYNICDKSSSINKNDDCSSHSRSRQKSPQLVAEKVIKDTESEIHQRYLEYINLSPAERESNKTDYTYAHSFSYNPYLPRRERYRWTVPNMSRHSVAHYNSSSNNNNNNNSSSSGSINSSPRSRQFSDKQRVTAKIFSSASPDKGLNETVYGDLNTTTGSNRSNTSHLHHYHHQAQQRLSPNSISNMSSITPTKSSSVKTIRAAAAAGRANIMEEQAILTSTPITASSQAGINRRINIGKNIDAYSDDEDENVAFEQQLQQQAGRSNGKTTKARKGLFRASSNNENQAQLSSDDDEEPDEEEITIIRRINNYVTTTVRNIFTGGSSPKPPPPAAAGREEERDPIRASAKIYSSQSYQHRSLTAGGNNRYYNSYRYNTSATTTTTNRASNSLANSPLALIFAILAIISSAIFGVYYLRSSDSSGGGHNNNLNNLLENLSQPVNGLTNFLFRSSASVERQSSSPSTFDTHHHHSHPHSLDISQSFNFEIQSLRNEIEAMKARYDDGSSSRSISENGGNLSPPASTSSPKFDEILHRLAMLESKIANCCERANITTTVTNLTETIDAQVRHHLDARLFHFQAAYDAQLRNEIDKLSAHLIAIVREQAEISATKAAAASVENEYRNRSAAAAAVSSFDPNMIESMIKMAIAKYDADKTGEADYALESSGAYVVSTRCSETYELRSASYKLLGVTLWRSHNTPRVVIQSGVVPGECWCFTGAEGRIAIHLSARIIPTAFTYEHIPKTLSRDGNVRSAPAMFAVYGLKGDDDTGQGDLLGEYRYLINDGSDDDDKDDKDKDNHRPRPEPLQRFAVQNTNIARHSFPVIELVVRSNHGHPQYTCLYRFRVHGTPLFDANL